MGCYIGEGYLKATLRCEDRALLVAGSAQLCSASAAAAAHPTADVCPTLSRASTASNVTRKTCRRMHFPTRITCEAETTKSNPRSLTHQMRRSYER